MKNYNFLKFWSLHVKMMKRNFWQARRLQLIRKTKKKYSLGYYPIFFEPFNQERKIKYLSSLQSLITRFFQNLFCILTADRDWDKRGMKFKTRSRSLVIPRTCQKRGLTSGNRLARLRRLGHDAAPAENRRFAGHN